MKCVTCEMEINTKWKHAIDMNSCPFCGQEIMEGQLKELLSSLHETMHKLSEYPDQLNDWMLSNFNFVKTNSDKIHFKEENDKEKKKFKVKVITDTGEEEVVAEKIQSEERTNDFYKRAEAIKPNLDGFKSISEKTQHLRAMTQQIKREGSTVINQSGKTEIITPEMIEVADPQAVAEMNAIMSGNNDGLIGSSLASEYNGDDEIPAVILNMANNSKNPSNASHADLMKLKQMHNRVNSARANFESGANRGKNGFSRS